MFKNLIFPCTKWQSQGVPKYAPAVRVKTDTPSFRCRRIARALYAISVVGVTSSDTQLCNRTTVLRKKAVSDNTPPIAWWQPLVWCQPVYNSIVTFTKTLDVTRLCRRDVASTKLTGNGNES